MAHTPLRTCIGCRSAGPASDLERLVLVDGQVVLAPAAGRSGRGASLHRSAACVASAVKSGAFGRAFRRRVELLDPVALLKLIEGVGRP